MTLIFGHSADGAITYKPALHYVTSKSALGWPSDYCCSTIAASVLRQTGSPPLLHRSPDYTPPQTTTDTHTAASDLKIISRIEVIRYQRRPRQILQVNLLFLAGSRGWGEATQERRPPDRLDCGVCRFSLGWEVERRTSIRLRQKPTLACELKLIFSYFDCLTNIDYAIDD